jgi:DNA-nicking Smr family endonuclease
MADVQRLKKGTTRVHKTEKPAPVVRRADSAPAAAPSIESEGDEVRIFDPGVPTATRRALRRRTAPPEATLDLHGLRAPAARARLITFVQEARRKGQRHVLVITGRGVRSGPEGPVLRRELIALVTEGALRAAVLALVSAPPTLGGAGAFWLLLRKA